MVQGWVLHEGSPRRRVVVVVVVVVVGGSMLVLLFSASSSSCCGGCRLSLVLGVGTKKGEHRTNTTHTYERAHTIDGI